MAISEIKEKDFAAEVLDYKGGVVVDFYANWCGPCKALRPILEELSEEYGGVKFVSVDVDEAETLAYRYSVSSIPCVVFIRDGVEVSRSIGIRPKDLFIENINLIQ